MGVLLRRGLIAVLGGAGVGLSALGLGLAWQPKVQPNNAPSPPRPLIIDGPPTDVPPAPTPPPRPTPTEPFAADMDDEPGPDGPPPVEEAAAEAAAAPSPEDAPPGEPGAPGPAAAGPMFAPPPEARAEQCAELGSPADRLVCATPGLVAADLRLRRLYRRALDDTADPEGLRDDQRRWDRDRDRVAQLAGPRGLAQLYDERIQELSGPG